MTHTDDETTRDDPASVRVRRECRLWLCPRNLYLPDIHRERIETLALPPKAPQAWAHCPSARKRAGKSGTPAGPHK